MASTSEYVPSSRRQWQHSATARRWRPRDQRVGRRRSIAATDAAHVTMRRMRRRPRCLRPSTAQRHLPEHQQCLDAPEAPTTLRLAEITNFDLIINYLIEFKYYDKLFRGGFLFFFSSIKAIENKEKFYRPTGLEPTTTGLRRQSRYRSS